MGISKNTNLKLPSTATLIEINVTKLGKHPSSYGARFRCEEAMKCTIPEISWHNREPVLSVDINPVSSEIYRLATSGGDSHVLIWHASLSENGAVKQELVSDLTRHQRAVNVVRWSPSGQYLASADDDANIIIWQRKTDSIPLLEGDTGDKEIWIVYKILRGHKEDIYDLCWSVDGLKLLSGSIDNTAILWDITKGKLDHILSDHKGFVQGVAWDPKDQLIATICTDRICRVINTNGKQIKARIHKGRLPVPSDHYLFNKDVKYFHDDTFKSFFRRLQFSPDGSLLVVPSGHIESEDCKKPLNATLIFTLDNLNEPRAVLPLKKQCSTAVRFCPVLFELYGDGPKPIVDLPYRMIFAVGTDHDVILYDTQQTVPFARFQEIHYTRLTDLTWSGDGRLLVASSTDGFCALITFEVDELGVPYVKEDSEAEENPMDVSGCEELEKEEVVGTVEKPKEKKRPSFIEQWAIKTPKRIKLGDENKKAAVTEGKDVIELVENEEDVRELPNEIREEINKLIPRRAIAKVENSTGKDDVSVAKPIAVRRKPRMEEGGKDVAKPIEVRRKPRDPNDLKENRPVNNYKMETSTEPTHLEVKGNCGVDKPSKKGVNGEHEEVIEIDDDDDLENRHNKATKSQKTDTKFTETSKIKVSSLIKKKITPPKNNSLLKFLKSTAPKGKKPATKAVPSCVDVTLAEEEARDAWKCEKEPETVNRESATSSKSEPMEEDCTEDFCLQLEDTRESETKSKKDPAVERKKSRNGGSNVEDNSLIEISDSSNDSTDKGPSKATDAKNVEQKVPRRVALITLESPKGKKKQKV